MSEFVTIYRGGVNAWECDVMGHLNLQYYAAKLTEGLGHLGQAMAPAETDAARLRHRHWLSRYQGELQAGEMLDIRAAVLAVGEGSVDLLAEIVNVGTQRLSASFEMRCDNFDAAAQKVLPWGDETRRRLEDMIAERTGKPRPPTAGSPIAPPSMPLREPFVSARGGVDAWQCDGDGALARQFYYAIGYNGVSHIRQRMGLTRDIATANQWGGAALEYGVDFLAPVKAGDVYTLRSGLLEVGNKIFRVGHHLHNDSSGELAAVYDVVACMFDLKARRAMTIPEPIRSQAKTLLIGWPPAG